MLVRSRVSEPKTLFGVVVCNNISNSNCSKNKSDDHLPLSPNLHLCLFIFSISFPTQSVKADGRPPESGSSRRFFPLGSISWPLSLHAYSGQISEFSSWLCKAPQDATWCDLACWKQKLIDWFWRVVAKVVSQEVHRMMITHWVGKSWMI